MKIFGALLVLSALACVTQAVDQEIKWTVTGSGSNALRDYVSDGVGNATQDSDLGGLYLPFYTEGTGTGQQKFLNSSVDYTVGDYALSASNYASAGRPIIQFPIALGSVAIWHNITKYTSPNTLRINSTVAALIFQGNITHWDDPLILELNPNFTKFEPSPIGKNITVIVRTDSFAAQAAFTKWLNLTVPDIWKLGVNSTISWPQRPNFKYVVGGSNLTAAVLANQYSITFTDGYAGRKAKLADAAVRNKNGDWVRYNNGNFSFIDIGNDTIAWPSSPSDDWSKFNIVNLGGNKTYPIPTAAFAASNIDLRDKDDRGAAQKQVFGYLLGPNVAKRASWYNEYALPPAFLNQSIAATKLIKVKSKLTFFEPNQLPSLGAPYSVSFSA